MAAWLQGHGRVEVRDEGIERHVQRRDDGDGRQRREHGSYCGRNQPCDDTPEASLYPAFSFQYDSKLCISMV